MKQARYKEPLPLAVIEAARALSLTVHDHLIVGREGVASFKQLGLM